MTPRGLPRMRPMTDTDVRVRAETARKYLEVAEMLACLAEKSNAQYGTTYLSTATVATVVQHARTLVESVPQFVR